MSDSMLSFYHDFLDQWPLIYLGIWATIKLTVVISVSGFFVRHRGFLFEPE